MTLMRQTAASQIAAYLHHDTSSEGFQQEWVGSKLAHPSVAATFP